MLPTQASAFSSQVDSIFMASLIASVVILLAITATIVYFVVRYSRENNPEPEDIEGNLALEVVWTVIPTVLFLVMFYFGWTGFQEMRTAPADSMVVKVVGRQWAWSFQYPDGRWSDELYVSLNRPVKLELESKDVLHGFAIAAFRVKSDVIPGRSTYVWFDPSLLGTFDIQCTVICGVSHSYMLSKVHVLREDDFRAWYFRDESAPKPAPPRKPSAADSRARKILDERQCLVCHTVDGTPMLGPSFLGLFGAERLVISSGKQQKVAADEAYLRRAIQEPGADVVVGFPPSMPVGPLSKPELDSVVAYLKSLSAPAAKKR
ncbi:MAG: cytochrome c oxidase subunit II [Elusimicrobia bacterium RIFOXYD12_FULL_66_9]|nr:MAG: cytochrome c oxidase subunit II [Elusimicrobia bacterium RIFOXYD12_FULL_66_9]